MTSQGEAPSILYPAAIATLANEGALDDLALLFASLKTWNVTLPPIFLYCTEEVAKWARTKQAGTLQIKTSLEKYKGLNRAQMEKMPSRCGLPNLFSDFTQEKCGLMEWALKSLPLEKKTQGVLFCDADILWFGPLPTIPAGSKLALSPHEIRQADEMRQGIQNAGFLWMNDETLPQKWYEECKKSRFFEQAALEVLPSFQSPEEVVIFPTQVNQGWWRMFQSPQTAEQKQAEWSIKRDITQSHSGLHVNGKPLLCIHTHWKTTDQTTAKFNDQIKGKLSLLKSQSKVKQFAATLGLTFH